MPRKLCILRPSVSILVVTVSQLLAVLAYGFSLSLSPDAQVLLSLKKSLYNHTGSNPDKLNSWKDEDNSNPSSHCFWTGVQCDPLNRVVGLNISGMNLFGSISPEIRKLHHLANLTVACSTLTGPLPSEITDIQGLRYLNISNNVFIGNFPSNVSKWKELEVMDAYNNNFSGPLPVEFSKLRKLKHLHLGGNYFSGKIPSEYSHITSLNYLALAGNELTGRIPGELTRLVNLEELYIGYYNNYQSEIPSEFGEFTNLVRLDMANCGLVGSIPPELGQLVKLDSLFLQVNYLTGHIPAQLANLSALKSLDLSNNNLTGEIPAEFIKLQNLTLLFLFKNRLHGTIPSFIAELPNLEVLGLWGNNFTGGIPQNLGRNGRLLILDLSFNKFTGLLPPDLCAGGKLQILIVIHNVLFGPIPESLGSCKSLTKVRMGQNFFNGSIPKGLLSLPLVQMLELDDNDLSGGIPTPIPVTWNLTLLSLSNNSLTGFLPPAIGNLSRLEKLDVSGNKFTGHIPSQIGRLKKLYNLKLSNNRFSGNIPAEISECKVLVYLDLSKNDLSGNIPLEITQLIVLDYLNISRNHLVGVVPKDIGGMRSLTSLDLSYNSLSGHVPTNGQFSYFSANSFVGNLDLCGRNLTPCSNRAQSQGDLKGPLSSTFFKLLVAAFLFCSLAFAIPAIVKFRALLKTKSSRGWKLTVFQRLHFTCEDVLACLKEDNIIGKGGSGVVYKGLMPKGEEVAVKRLPAIGKGSFYDHGFSAEIQTLGKIRHRHIVKLLGFCSNQQTNLLVYEYMQNGSLGDLLHGTKSGHLQWDTRYKIAIEAAKGLCYLHHDCCPRILHRDVKSNNILLDSNFEAHVADFGLAKFLQDLGENSQCMSSVAGSYGYIAPEYAYTLKVDEKSDVYSFGVVLLELITGRKPVGDFGDGVDIVQWVKKMTGSASGGVAEVMDTRFSPVPLDQVMHVFDVAMRCVEEKKEYRPTMRDVVQKLISAPTTKRTKELSSPTKQEKDNEEGKPAAAASSVWTNFLAYNK